MRAYAAAWDARVARFRASPGTPGCIPVPWDEFEQELDCIRLYYRHLRGMDALEGVEKKYASRK